tara:strand:+ start:56037 stop:56174 length:138 start_codon:yes stop_codon:yes gene_type:complete
LRAIDIKDVLINTFLMWENLLEILRKRYRKREREREKVFLDEVRN